MSLKGIFETCLMLSASSTTSLVKAPTPRIPVLNLKIGVKYSIPLAPILVIVNAPSNCTAPVFPSRTASADDLISWAKVPILLYLHD